MLASKVLLHHKWLRCLRRVRIRCGVTELVCESPTYGAGWRQNCLERIDSADYTECVDKVHGDSGFANCELTLDAQLPERPIPSGSDLPNSAPGLFNFHTLLHNGKGEKSPDHQEQRDTRGNTNYAALRAARPHVWPQEQLSPPEHGPQ